LGECSCWSSSHGCDRHVPLARRTLARAHRARTSVHYSGRDGSPSGSPLSDCGLLSQRVPGRSVRTLDDLPWHGGRVRIEAHVHQFFCDTPGCPRRIFTERLSETTVPHARRTNRAATALELIGFALGGRPGERLAVAMGLAGGAWAARGRRVGDSGACEEDAGGGQCGSARPRCGCSTPQLDEPLWKAQAGFSNEEGPGEINRRKDGRRAAPERRRRRLRAVRSRTSAVEQCRKVANVTALSWRVLLVVEQHFRFRGRRALRRPRRFPASARVAATPPPPAADSRTDGACASRCW